MYEHQRQISHIWLESAGVKNRRASDWVGAQREQIRRRTWWCGGVCAVIIYSTNEADPVTRSVASLWNNTENGAQWPGEHLLE